MAVAQLTVSSEILSGDVQETLCEMILTLESGLCDAYYIDL